MEFGIFSIGAMAPHPVTGEVMTERERLRGVVELGVLTEQVGMDVFAVGEHHDGPYVTSSPTVILGHLAARTTRLRLSTAVTVLTTLDPVRVAEDFATLSQLSDGRVDLMIGKGVSWRTFPMFGRDPQDQDALLEENHLLLRKLWRETDLEWSGRYRTPLRRVTILPRPYGEPPVMWHGAVRSPATAETAARYGEPLFLNNLFGPLEHFGALADHYRRAWAAHGRNPQDAVLGAGGQLHIARRSQDAVAGFRPYHSALIASRGGFPTPGGLEREMAGTTLTVGSPQQVVEAVLSFRERYGHQRQLFALDMPGMPYSEVAEQIELFGAEVLPHLRQATGPARGALSGASSTGGEDGLSPQLTERAL